MGLLCLNRVKSKARICGRISKRAIADTLTANVTGFAAAVDQYPCLYSFCFRNGSQGALCRFEVEGPKPGKLCSKPIEQAGQRGIFPKLFHGVRIVFEIFRKKGPSRTGKILQAARARLQKQGSLFELLPAGSGELPAPQPCRT